MWQVKISQSACELTMSSHLYYGGLTVRGHTYDITETHINSQFYHTRLTV